MSLRELIKVMPAPKLPTEVGSEEELRLVERELGVKFPQDYREFVHAYGSGSIEDFIRVLNPFSASDRLGFVPRAKKLCDILRGLREMDIVPYPVYPDKGGLLPWGWDDNGNNLFWLASGKPDKWSTVLGAGRGHKWERFNYPMTTFLAKVLTGTVTSDIWPGDFPDKNLAPELRFSQAKERDARQSRKKK